ncbi:MAG: cobyric acid synthase CobQ, partial [Gluconobacter sp.]
RLTEVSGLLVPEGTPLTGYEIHVGRTASPDTQRPFATVDGEPEGAVSPDGRVWGTYLHGVLSGGDARKALLSRVGRAGHSDLQNHGERVEAALDAWADHLEACIDLDALLALARPV